MANLSKLKRERMLEFLNKIRDAHKDDMDYSQANRHKNAKNFVNQGSICLSDNPSPFR